MPSPTRSAISASDLGPWILHRTDVDLVDPHVHAQADVDALQPEQQVGVGQREPELILGQAQQHRVVEDAAALVAQDHVLAVHRRDAGGVARNGVVDEPFRVRSLHADLPFHRHVPHGDVVGQRLVLGGRAAIFRAHVARAGGRCGCTPWRAQQPALVRQVPVGRLAHAGGDQQLGGGAPALAQVDRGRCGRTGRRCVVAWS